MPSSGTPSCSRTPPSSARDAQLRTTSSPDKDVTIRPQALLLNGDRPSRPFVLAKGSTVSHRFFHPPSFQKGWCLYATFSSPHPKWLPSSRPAVWPTWPALPNALAKLGHDVRVILPLYSAIPAQWRRQMTFLKSFHFPLSWRNAYCGLFSLEYQDGVTYYFIDNEYYFKRSRISTASYDDGERFAYFSRAVVESPRPAGLVAGRASTATTGRPAWCPSTCWRQRHRDAPA